MAERKPLFIGSEGYHEEMAISDSLTLSGLTMGGAIDMNSAGKIVGSLAATASQNALVYGQTGQSVTNMTITGTVTNATHAATKAYADAAAVNAGSVKEAVLLSSQLSVTQGIRAGCALTLQNQAANDDRVVLTDGTTTRTYYFGTGTGDVQVTIGADIAESMTNLRAAINTDGSGAWYADVSTTGWDSIDDDGVIVIYEQSTAGAASKIYGTNWDAGDCQIVDYSDVSDYTKVTLEDIPSSAPGATNFGFRRTKANLTNGEMHIDLLGDVLYCWDDDADIWQVYSGTGSVIDATGASGGGVLGKASYDSDKAMAVSSGIVTLDLHASSGLQFDATDKGLKIRSDQPTRLYNTASGLICQGVSSSFKINGVATNGTYVTAANVDDICDGSNADSLHVHTATSVTLNHSDVSNVGTDDHHAQQHAVQSTSDHSESGLTTGHVLTATAADAFAWQAPAEATAAQKIENTWTTATDATSDGDPIYWNGNNTVGKARADTAVKARVTGLIRTASGAAGATPEVVTSGPCADILSGATVNTPYFLQSTGGIGTSLPGSGERIILVGYALNATDLFVRIEDYGQKA